MAFCFYVVFGAFFLAFVVQDLVYLVEVNEILKNIFSPISIMAIITRIFVVLAILNVVLLPTTTIATQYVVGDDRGWTIDFDYQAWASKKTFKVGDTLVFIYPKGIHNVFNVDGNSFAKCIIPPPSKAFTSGHDVVPLLAPGKVWFICGVEDHCIEFNQKLVIDVKA
ncbi:hypothetical protein L1887_01144 [Cichorium endivia]|nr:hypothetical protein L1887_01144 [Cichorium endivia]